MRPRIPEEFLPFPGFLLLIFFSHDLVDSERRAVL